VSDSGESEKVAEAPEWERKTSSAAFPLITRRERRGASAYGNLDGKNLEKGSWKQT
jgi:hypothetical protein